MIELIVDGWAVDHLSYADRSGASGSAGPPGALIALRRGREREWLCVPDDARHYSHRALVALFRERPQIWKYRTSEGAAAAAADATPPDDWADVSEPFPETAGISAKSLRGVEAVNLSQAVGGTIIALTAIERYDTAARLRLLLEDAEIDLRRDPRLLDVVAVDDRARLYRVATVEQVRGAGLAEGEIIIGPAPPREIALLTVVIGSLGDRDHGTAPIEGPWVFPIVLGSRG